MWELPTFSKWIPAVQDHAQEACWSTKTNRNRIPLVLDLEMPTRQVREARNFKRDT
jgi:hypothetical protein